MGTSISDEFTCDIDGSWVNFGGANSYGDACTGCTPQVTVTWFKTAKGSSPDEVASNVSTNFCATNDADNYTISANVGVATRVGKYGSIERCLYADGSLSTSSIYACGITTAST